MSDIKVLPLLFSLVGVVQAPVALAQSAGIFTATGNMTAPRFSHTATLLPDGRVLITGGFTACSIGTYCLTPDHAELYDPATGTFTATGSMTTAYATGAVLLPNGKVLIAGYLPGVTQATASVELYDPSTGEFNTAGKPATLKTVGSTALLNDGRVLLIGDGAELYDPVSGTFSPVANWPGKDFRPDDAATSSYWYPAVLASGKVLLAPYDSVSGCEIYDPATGAFNLTGALGYFLGVPHRTLLLNGAVLFTGGSDGLGNVNRAELYDPAAGVFASTGSMFTSRDENHSTTLLPDGTVLVAGGAGQSGCMQPALAGAEIYDPATSRFSTTGSLASARVEHTATLLNNGQVLITGGMAFTAGCFNRVGDSINGISSAELYTPAALVPAPALFSISGDGKGQGAILHANTPRVASSSDPAVAGDYLEIYLTGLGDGSAIPPQVAIGGRMAEILYFGKSGYAGLNQVNVRVPKGVTPGPAVPVRVNYLGRPSNVVTIGVQRQQPQ